MTHSSRLATFAMPLLQLASYINQIDYFTDLTIRVNQVNYVAHSVQFNIINE